MRVRSSCCAAFVVLVVAIVFSAAPAGAGPDGSARSTDPLPVSYSAIDGIVASFVHPLADPPGANDWSCRPSRRHPHPVVLVHGTLANQTNSWNALSPLLKNNGYCVFALNYGGLLGDQFAGTGPIAASAAELATFVDRVLGATGAGEVDLVGHSQGGMMPRYYLTFLGGAAKVRALVGLAPSNHGTTLFGLAALAALVPDLADLLVGSWCAACLEQIDTSAFMQRLNAGGDTVDGVEYTVIQTRYDEIVTPHTSAFLDGRNVHNITVQDHCPLDLSEHLSIAFDQIALTHVLNALDPRHPRRVPCVPIAPIIGG